MKTVLAVSKSKSLECGHSEKVVEKFKKGLLRPQPKG